MGAFNLISKILKMYDTISDLDTQVSENTKNIKSHTSQIQANLNNITTNTNNITANTNGITANTNSIKKLQPYMAINDYVGSEYDLPNDSNATYKASTDYFDISHEDEQYGRFQIKTKKSGYFAVGGRFANNITNALTNFIGATIYNFFSTTYIDYIEWASDSNADTDEIRLDAISQVIVDGRSLTSYSNATSDMISPFVYVEAGNIIVIDVDYHGVAQIKNSPMHLYYFPVEIIR